MFITRVNSYQNFGARNVAATQHNQNEGRQMTDSQKLDLLIKKMNTLQMDVEKMRARQMVADKVIATGVMNLLKQNAEFAYSPKADFMSTYEGVQALDEMA